MVTYESLMIILFSFIAIIMSIVPFTIGRLMIQSYIDRRASFIVFLLGTAEMLYGIFLFILGVLLFMMGVIR